MKKILVVSLFSLTFLWNSCSNDFDVAAPWKDIPVVYGLLNATDEVHYIRVEKAFLDPDGDALEIAKIPDSLYYDELTVQFEKVATGEIFTLDKVNGTDIGLVRDSGIFATEPNWLYKVDDAVIDLTEGDSIFLMIDRGNGLPLVTAGTLIQSEGRLRTPNLDAGQPQKLDFSSINPEEIKWQSSPDARIFDVTLFFNYVEYPGGDVTLAVEKSVEWKWVTGLRFDRPEVTYEVEKETAEFYDVLSNNIETNPDMTRFFKDCRIKIVSGGINFEKYVSVEQANSGITGSQEAPTFTNLSEGIGVFSSINILDKPGILLSAPTLDSIRMNALTAPLNFQ